MSREKFEQHLGIQWLERFEFIEKASMYIVKDEFRDSAMMLCKQSEINAAWGAWQEQQKRIDEYELVADSLDDLYQRERTKNKELQRRIEELERMRSEEKRILHNVIDIERNKNQRVEQ